MAAHEVAKGTEDVVRSCVDEFTGSEILGALQTPLSISTAITRAAIAEATLRATLETT